VSGAPTRAARRARMHSKPPRPFVTKFLVATRARAAHGRSERLPLPCAARVGINAAVEQSNVNRSRRTAQGRSILNEEAQLARLCHHFPRCSARGSPRSASHTFTVLSVLPEAMRLPSAENATLVTGRVCP